jgi:uncharacterized protein
MRTPNHVPLATIAERLREATAGSFHAFWSDDVSILDSDVANIARIHGPRQLTDAYLVALAVKHHGRLVTFDGRMVRSAAVGSTDAHLVVL